jgi:hypothetical protein
MDIRQPISPRNTSPNKLHKPNARPAGPIGVQSQTVVTATGQEIDPNALPIFPSPNKPPSSANVSSSANGVPQRSSYPDDRQSHASQDYPEKPKLTLAMLEDMRQQARNRQSDPVIQLDLAKALLEASTSLSQESGMGDPKRVVKARDSYIAEAYKIVKKLSSVRPGMTLT